MRAVPSPVVAGQPPAPQPPARPGPTIPARAVWWAVLGLLVGEVLGSILAAIAAAGTGSARGPVATLVGELGLWAGMLGACLLVSRHYGTGSLTRDYTLGFRPRDLLFGLGAAIAGLVAAQVVSAAFAGTSLHGTNTQILSGERGNGVGFAVVTLIAAIGAPFFEELFFRGLLRTALAARLGPVGAIWVQAIIFGALHYGGAGYGLANVSVVLAIAAFGVILGYTARLTGRLGAGMVAHCLFNLAAAVTILAT